MPGKLSLGLGLLCDYYAWSACLKMWLKEQFSCSPLWGDMALWSNMSYTILPEFGIFP
jgi:hypothetical protein